MIFGKKKEILTDVVAQVGLGNFMPSERSQS